MKNVDDQTAPESDPEELPQRLCSEIQLFDLCDLDKCSFKEGRYCTHADLLARFEALAEPEERPSRHDADDDDDLDEEVSYPEETDEDDEDYSVFDDEDELEGRSEDEW